MSESTEPTALDPNELVDVINPVNGDRNRVGRAYLERWPDDYVLAEEASPAEGSEPSKSWTVIELKTYAADNEIDLGSAATKAEILAAIEAAPKTPVDQAEEPNNPVDDPEKEPTE